MKPVEDYDFKVNSFGHMAWEILRQNADLYKHFRCVAGFTPEAEAPRNSLLAFGTLIK